MQKGSGDNEAQSKSDTLSKLVLLAEFANKKSYYDDGNGNICHVKEKERSTWLKNVILISCSFQQCFEKFDKKVLENILLEYEASKTIKEYICLGLARERQS